jgi:hypothetical protein
MTGDILDDLFTGCALTAFLEIWEQTGQFPPDSEATRRLAYRYYEEALAEKNRQRGPRHADGQTGSGDTAA